MAAFEGVDGADLVAASIGRLLQSPPSEEELRRRLVARDTEDEASLELRFNNAVAELADGAAYDHRVVNDDVFRAAEEILDIVRSRRAAICKSSPWASSVKLSRGISPC